MFLRSKPPIKTKHIFAAPPPAEINHSPPPPPTTHIYMYGFAAVVSFVWVYSLDRSMNYYYIGLPQVGIFIVIMN